jgi:branched-chain amino acid transport system substrate-binding protein
MIERRPVVRNLLIAVAVVGLGGCKVIPRGPVQPAPLPPPAAEEPATGLLPSDRERHRLALLVPMSGANAAVGQSIANAATMALLDTGSQNLRITTYDTATGAQSAAARALQDGNRLILGPLLSDDVRAVAVVARPARVPMITFSNDSRVAGPDVFVLGLDPGQAVARVMTVAKAQGTHSVAALIPAGDYGERSSAALASGSRDAGLTLAATETYDRGNTSITSAARRLKQAGGYDAVLIADAGRIAAQAAPLLKAVGAASPRLLGTELWSGDSTVLTSPSLRGGWFAALSDARYPQFVSSYRARFGAAPHRLATLGYDSVLLSIRVAREWRPGRLFPVERLYETGGFLGLDGPFRFRRDSVAERALEVREVGQRTTTVISPAPTQFAE